MQFRDALINLKILTLSYEQAIGFVLSEFFVKIISFYCGWQEQIFAEAMPNIKKRNCF